MTNSSTGIEVQTQESQTMSSNYSASQEFSGGMTKIIPSNIDVSVVILNETFDW